MSHTDEPPDAGRPDALYRTKHSHRMTGKVWLHELTWEEVRDHLLIDNVILLPVGSTEQHGTHLPLGTDTLTAIGLAVDAATAAGALVAPPLWYGWSPHHLAYPGSITLVPEHLAAVVVDVGLSLVYHGFRRLVIINGHREANLPPLKIAQTRLVNEAGQAVVIVDPFHFGWEIGNKIRASAPGGVGHADELETGHMLHLRPDLVDMDKAVRNIPKERRFFSSDLYVPGNRVAAASSIDGYRARTDPYGTSGDPLPATAEKGRLYHETIVKDIVALIEDLRQMRVEVKDVRPPI